MLISIKWRLYNPTNNTAADPTIALHNNDNKNCNCGIFEQWREKKNGLQKIEKSFASFYRSAAFIFV